MSRLETHELARRAIERLAGELESGQSDRLKAYLAMLGRFRTYSPGNILLICMQCPQATHVAGYRAWQRLGRQVSHGAKAIRILAPMIRRARQAEDEQERVVGFKTACVFDVTQTEGRPLPEFARVAGDPRTHLDNLRRLIRQRGLGLQYVENLGGADGLSSRKQIIMKAGLPPAEEFAVMVHELAHVSLHHGAGGRPDSKRVRETEAEAVAFVVCSAIGLETGTAASDYIQLYQGDGKTLLASLERIQKTAAEIIDGVLEGGQRKRAGLVADPAMSVEPLPQVVKRLAA